MLKFFDAGHIYELDGERIPSVSEILHFVSREIYGEINKYILDHAAERGTSVHQATEVIDLTGECQISPLYQGYLQAYVKFLHEHEVQWLYSEKALADREKRYAGTIDRTGMVDGAFCILDIKTNGVIKKPLVKAQLNAYHNLCKVNGIGPIEKLLCLQLMENSRYRLYEVAFGMEEFLSCLLLHNALLKKHKRGKIQ